MSSLFNVTTLFKNGCGPEVCFFSHFLKNCTIIYNSGVLGTIIQMMLLFPVKVK